MKTKLEMMVAYMAGRKGEAAESIRRERDDPTSDASLCLEALRSRSRRMFGANLPEMADPIPSPAIRWRMTAREKALRRFPSLLIGGSSAALVLIALGLAWRAQDDRLRQLEVTLARREAGWGDRFNRLEAALTRRETPSQTQSASSVGPKVLEPKPPTSVDTQTSLALARLEARLGELGQRIGEGQPRQVEDDQQVAQLRRDLDRLRQEVESAGRASKQESEGLSLAVGEILDLLRRLTMRLRATEPMQLPAPMPVLPQGHEAGFGQGPGMMHGPGQVPGQAQLPGQDHSYGATGRGKR
jgi:hypothetical protein